MIYHRDKIGGKSRKRLMELNRKVTLSYYLHINQTISEWQKQMEWTSCCRATRMRGDSSLGRLERGGLIRDTLATILLGGRLPCTSRLGHCFGVHLSDSVLDIMK